MKLKFNDIDKKRNSIESEKKIIDEMRKDVEKHVSNERNSHANQQALGMREAFRGLVVKEWTSMTNETIDYSQHDNRDRPFVVEFLYYAAPSRLFVVEYLCHTAHIIMIATDYS